MTDQYVTMGRIVGVYGVKGWVKVKPYTESLENLADYPQWFLRNKDHWQKQAVEAVRVHGSGLVAKLLDVDDRDEAALLMRCDIAVDRQSLPDLQEGEYYWHQLIGLTVVNNDGHRFGQIKRMLETGANDVMIIEGMSEQKPKEVLIPYIWASVVKRVDLKEQTVWVDWHKDWE